VHRNRLNQQIYKIRGSYILRSKPRSTLIEESADQLSGEAA